MASDTADRWNGTTGSVFGQLAVLFDYGDALAEFQSRLASYGPKTLGIMGRVDRIIQANAEQAISVLETLGQDVLEEAQQEVPVDTGQLRDSAFKEIVEVPGGVAVEISFGTDRSGNEPAPWAGAQHEHFYAHPNGGKRKYLEDPLMRAPLFSAMSRAVRAARIEVQMPALHELAGLTQELIHYKRGARVAYRDPRTGRFARNPYG